MKIPLDKIIIGERQRQDLGDLSELDSMADPEVGLIQPIVVHKTLSGYELVAGRRRLTKASQLGWPDIEAYERDTLTEVQKNKMELYEDLQRKERTWQELVLSIYKIHHMLVREKRQDGESWTIKNTASFTNFGPTTIRWFVRLADALLVEPKDAKLWDCTTYTEAQQHLIGNQENEARAELERRRAILNKQESLPSLDQELIQTDSCKTCGVAYSDHELADHPFLAWTELNVEGVSSEEPVKKQIIHVPGYNLDFAAAVPDEHFLEAGAYAVIAWKAEPRHGPNIIASLRPDGFAVLWEQQGAFVGPIHWMPGFLIWNKVSMEEPTNWPFVHNWRSGMVLSRTKRTTPWPNASTSTVSCHHDTPDELPFAVVDFCLRAIAPPNVTVLCPVNAPVVQVAESGHIPVFFEPDPAKFEAKCKALVAYYESVIPGVTVKIG